MIIKIGADESVTLIGRTGSGKTNALKILIKANRPTGRYRIAILDTKQVGDYSEFPQARTLKEFAKLIAENPIVVYSPIDSEANDPDFIDGFLKFCYERWNTRVVIDEMSSIVDNNNLLTNYINISDRGRARHVTFFQATQKPVFIPHAALSEAAHFFIFDLLMEDARIKVSKLGLGKKALQRPIDRYGFWYYKVTEREPIYFSGFPYKGK